MIKKILLIALISFTNFAMADDADLTNAKAFVSHLSDTTMSVISSNDDDSEKEQKLTDLFLSTVDVKWIGNFALGRYSKTIDDGQRNKYNDLFSKYLVKSYVPNFRKYTKETIKVLGINKYSAKEFLVQTEIVRPSKEPLNINYMVRKQEGDKFLVFDIVAEGVSLINSLRSEFGSILQNSNIDGLINMLEKKINNK